MAIGNTQPAVFKVDGWSFFRVICMVSQGFNSDNSIAFVDNEVFKRLLPNIDFKIYALI